MIFDDNYGSCLQACICSVRNWWVHRESFALFFCSALVFLQNGLFMWLGKGRNEDSKTHNWSFTFSIFDVWIAPHEVFSLITCTLKILKSKLIVCKLVWQPYLNVKLYGTLVTNWGVLFIMTIQYQYIILICWWCLHYWL